MKNAIIRTQLSFCLVLVFLLSPPGLSRGFGEENAPDDMPPELVRVLEKVNEANENLGTLKADVDYTRTIPLLEESERSTGRLYFQAPEKIHMSLGEPRNEEMLSDGQRWWIIDHDARQVEIYETGGDQQVAETAFLELGYGRNVDELKDDYHIQLLSTEEVEVAANGERETMRRWHIRFRPRDEEKPAHYERTEVLITDALYLPEVITLYESDGEIIHTFQLEGLRVNEEIEESRFVYDIPRGYSTIRP